MSEVVSISVVIPTRNRPVSLARTLNALSAQQRLPDELIIVDASDDPLDPATLPRADLPVPVLCLHTAAGVCAQRNLGIQRARGTHVLLCDDDIEPPDDYLLRLSAYLEAHPVVGAASGLVSEPDHTGTFRGAISKPSLRHLLFAFLFQHTVWADVESASARWPAAWMLALLKRWYHKRNNTWSLAGWPLFTQLRGPVAHAAIYGLGAALVRRDWLLDSPFNEQLGPHGIGDNYGVTVNFPAPGGVAVLLDLPVLHHRDAENRLDPAAAYFRRVLALDYFTHTSMRFHWTVRFWLVWSLLGKAIIFGMRRQHDLLRRNAEALLLILRGRNPLFTRSTAQAPAAPGTRSASMIGR